MQFYEYPPKPWTELLSDCEDSARDLVSKLVVYESSQRLTATEVSSAKAIEGFFLFMLLTPAGTSSRLLQGQGLNTIQQRALD